MTPVPLLESNLGQVPRHVQTPRYSRSGLTAGIAHVGVGAFHRAHQAMAINELLNSTRDNPESMRWAIAGVGLMPGDRATQLALKSQDCLYTLINRGTRGSEKTRIIGSLVDYLWAPNDPIQVIELLAHPNTKIISLTITEGGYNRLVETQQFDFEDPVIKLELEGSSSPHTIFGYLANACKARCHTHGAGVTILSCDNLQANGNVLKSMLLAYVSIWDSDLVDWIETNVTFPNTMVDGITPVMTEALRASADVTSGVIDKAPVISEDYFQWVIEDDFAAGRPPLENHGCLLVKDVMPYELMKLRLLNLSHQALAYFAFLLGYRYVHEAARDADLQRFITNYMDIEAEPTLLPVEGIDLTRYKAGLLERFQNPHISDTIARLAEYTSDRIPQWLTPVVSHQLSNGGSLKYSAAIVASWVRYAEGTDEKGKSYDIVDSRREEVSQLARASRGDPLIFLQNRVLFGDLAQSDKFCEAYTKTLTELRQKGARLTLIGLNQPTM